MYTWGYLMDVSRAKLDLDENDPVYKRLLSSFKYYANEVMTQVCSTIKPKRVFATVIVNKMNVLTPIDVSPLLNDAFVSFGDDANTVTYEGYEDDWNNEVISVTSTDGKHYVTREAHDNDFKYVGYGKILCYREGTYQISCNTRWLDFTTVEPSTVLNVPEDILDCIPPYIASQCFKIDDEYKSSVFRNEYEMSLARVNDYDYKSTKTFTIGGGW